jgi:hypothetical protein
MGGNTAGSPDAGRCRRPPRLITPRRRSGLDFYVMGIAAGEPNAWNLTHRGEEVQQGIGMQ